MRVVRLNAINVRCLKDAECAPDAGVNVILGANGSGKTSFLEALSILCLGRSFVSNQTRDVVSKGENVLGVRGEFVDTSGQQFDVKVRKSKTATEIRLNGEPVKSASDLAQITPIVVIESQARTLLEEGPGSRRNFMDRTMFHVEPGYVGAWKNYRRALGQRNEVLRHRGSNLELAFWGAEMAKTADLVSNAREKLVSSLNLTLRELDPELPGKLVGFSLTYQPGWNREVGLESHLESTIQRDKDSGYTGIGAHRGDFSVKPSDPDQNYRLSRGLSKILAIAIYEAQGRFIFRRNGREPLYLVDDLAAEMDEELIRISLGLLTKSTRQCFYTSVKQPDLPEDLVRDGAMFHVEHDSDRRRSSLRRIL
jgi:DNA replication and repair protein RecF